MSLQDRIDQLQAATAHGSPLEQLMLHERILMVSPNHTSNAGGTTTHVVVFESRRQAILKPFGAQDRQCVCFCAARRPVERVALPAISAFAARRDAHRPRETGDGDAARHRHPARFAGLSRPRAGRCPGSARPGNAAKRCYPAARGVLMCLRNAFWAILLTQEIKVWQSTCRSPWEQDP